MYQELNFKKEPFETYFEFNDKFESVFEAEVLNEKLADFEWEAEVDRNNREYIRWVQDSLNRLMNLRLPVTGIMDAAARSALRSFQEKRGLPADGVAGPGTKRALAEARSRRSVFGGEGLQSETFEALYDESAGQFEFDASGTSTVKPASSYTTPTLDSMACRLLCASMLAYESTPGATSPYYKNAGFVEPPKPIKGNKPIDACLIGTLNGPAPGQKSVVLAFRGTAGGGTVASFAADWLNNFEAQLVPFTKIQSVKNPSVLVHKGFHDSVESFFGRGIVTTIKHRLSSCPPGAQLYITGHSKGGALAYLAALLLRTKHPEIPMAGVISFEAPRAGDTNFAKAYNDAKINSLRYEFQDDIAPHLPPSGIFAKSLVTLLASPMVAEALTFLFPKKLPLTYEHVGTLRFIDWSGSIVPDSAVLQAKRIAGLSKLVAEVAAVAAEAAAAAPSTTKTAAAAAAALAFAKRRLESLHSISCGSSADKPSSGAWLAICKTKLCP